MMAPRYISVFCKQPFYFYMPEKTFLLDAFGTEINSCDVPLTPFSELKQSSENKVVLRTTAIYSNGGSVTMCYLHIVINFHY